MTPGFLLGRLGLILLGVHDLHWLGFIMLSIGTALYAAGMSSVKAVKLTMKLTPGTPGALSGDVGAEEPVIPKQGTAVATVD